MVELPITDSISQHYLFRNLVLDTPHPLIMAFLRAAMPI
jgi:hypothetical protein